jgi:hypothetical protein
MPCSSHFLSPWRSPWSINFFSSTADTSLYAVVDTLKYFVAQKPDALILDFFAGSGTTLHAVFFSSTADTSLLVTQTQRL